MPRKKAGVVRPGVAPGRGGGGNNRQPPFIATDAQRNIVMALISFGTEIKTIAHLLRIPERTLFRHFDRELKDGRAVVHARVGAGIVSQALEGNLTAQIYYSKAQMGWRDRVAFGYDDGKGGVVPPASLYTVQITGLDAPPPQPAGGPLIEGVKVK